MTKSFRDALKERVLFLDGAMGTQIHAAQLELEARPSAGALHGAREALEGLEVTEEPRRAPALEIVSRRGLHGTSGIGARCRPARSLARGSDPAG